MQTLLDPSGANGVRLSLIIHRGPSARALWLCGPSAHLNFYRIENRALRPDGKLHAPIHVRPSDWISTNTNDTAKMECGLVVGVTIARLVKTVKRDKVGPKNGLAIAIMSVQA